MGETQSVYNFCFQLEREATLAQTPPGGGHLEPPSPVHDPCLGPTCLLSEMAPEEAEMSPLQGQELR